MKPIKVFLILSLILTHTLAVFALEPDTTAQTQASISTAAPSSGYNTEINSAVSDLNYKIEYLKARHDSLAREIEALKTADREQKKMIIDQNSSKLDLDRLNSIDAELGVIRSEMSQLREDIGILKSKSEAVEPPKKDILNSPWISVGSFVIAVIALLVH